jgi:hypothetical protein
LLNNYIVIANGFHTFFLFLLLELSRSWFVSIHGGLLCPQMCMNPWRIWLYFPRLVNNLFDWILLYKRTQTVSTSGTITELVCLHPWWVMSSYSKINSNVRISNNYQWYCILREESKYAVVKFKSSTRPYWFANCLADVVLGFFAAPFQWQSAMLNRWVLDGFMCKVAPFIKNVSVMVSVLTHVFVFEN